VAHVIPRRTPNPTPQGQEAQEPTVIVRFRDREVRNTVIQNRHKLKGTNRVIVEDLTALNVKCLNRVKTIQLFIKHGLGMKLFTLRLLQVYTYMYVSNHLIFN